MKAVVLTSGGLDSTTVLAQAISKGYQCHSLAFDYGQRHVSELNAAARISQALGAQDHRVLRLDLRAIGGSALTDEEIDVPTEETTGIPITYVPARNTVFLSLALGYAEVIGANAIFIGVNAVDYSGYPDCRPEFISAFQALAGVATRAGVEGSPLKIETPLLKLSKAEIVALGIGLGVDYGMTVSCYQANDAGEACGQCESCRLRKKGFADAGVPDPTRYIKLQF